MPLRRLRCWTHKVDPISFSVRRVSSAVPDDPREVLVESCGDVTSVPEYAGVGIIFAYSDGGVSLEACLAWGRTVCAQGARVAAIFVTQLLC